MFWGTCVTGSRSSQSVAAVGKTREFLESALRIRNICPNVIIKQFPLLLSHCFLTARNVCWFMQYHCNQLCVGLLSQVKTKMRSELMTFYDSNLSETCGRERNNNREISFLFSQVNLIFPPLSSTTSLLHCFYC